MSDFDAAILGLVSRPKYRPLTEAELAKALRIRKSQRKELRSSLKLLVRSGSLQRTREGAFERSERPSDRAGESASGTAKKGQSGLISGIARRTRRGGAYVIPHDSGDAKDVTHIFIGAQDVADAQSGDEVLVRLLNRRISGDRRVGRIEEVVERAATSFVGTYLERSEQGLVEIVGPSFRETVRVDDPGAKHPIEGDKVVVEMLRFPSPFQDGEAVITKVLGPRGQPGIDTQCIIHEFGLREEFPEPVLVEARKQAATIDDPDLTGRLDLTKELMITIDPADARDFDDAVSLTRREGGGWRLGVHIADVSQFVQPNSALDVEAQTRGTSVYLPNLVIPMLPEVLSNGVASLQQGRVRFTKSVFIDFSPEAVPENADFANTAIKVTRRFTYEEAMDVIRDPAKTRGRVGAKARALISEMHELAMALRTRRLQNGSLSLDLPEVKIEFNKQGEVIGANRVLQDESHQLIEEFMLAANQEVAKALKNHRVPFLRRIHEGPDLIKLQAFAQFVNTLGITLKQVQSRAALQSVLDRVKGEPIEMAVNYALLRAMKQAVYSPEDAGHYALAFDDYCHFTSPIRRYPDLMIHRLLDDLINRRRRRRVPNESELQKLGKHCSITERRAEQAERELKKLKLLTLLSNKIGQEYDAVITGVERFGMFCQLIEVPAEGLVHITTLDDDYYDFDMAARALIGRRRGAKYRLGDKTRVVVARVDLDTRELDFRLIAPPQGEETKRRKEKKRLPRGARG